MLIQLFICHIYLSYLFQVIKSEIITTTESLIPRDTLIRQDRVNGDYIHEILISIKQLNIEVLERELIERSSPGSLKYQKWMTYDEIGDLTSNFLSSNYVENWLLNEVNATITWTSRRKDFYKACAPISIWEKYFNTIFYIYHDFHINNLDSSSTITSNNDDIRKYNVHVLANDYTLPNYLIDHVSAIFYTCQAPPAMNKHYSKLSSISSDTENNYKKFRNDIVIKSYLRSNDEGIKRKTSSTVATDVNFLNKLYNIDSNLGNYLINQSVFETSNEDYSPNDLLLFQQHYDLTQEAALDIGGDISNTCGEVGGADCTEGNLDIQYIMGVAQRTTSFYWYVKGTNAYVNWITDVGEEVHPPTSNSMSWGSNEYTESISVMTSFNIAALKLTLLGVSITVSSGDNGAPSISSSNSACMCNTNSGSANSPWNGTNTWTGSGYFPSFPATCPYVTAVGATMGPNNNDGKEVVCQSATKSSSGEEIITGGIITTGGGFSTFFSRPSYQSNAIDSYISFINANSNSPIEGFNSYGRGIPDVSFLGTDYQVMIGGILETVFGTSCSSPVFAAMISLVNSARLAKNMSSLGFINPTLYNSTSFFNDITSGDNKCCAESSHILDPVCCNSGFTAIKGWDPTSGLGSITLSNLLISTGTNSATKSPSIDSNKTYYFLEIILVIAFLIICYMFQKFIVERQEEKKRQEENKRQSIVQLSFFSEVHKKETLNPLNS